MGLLWVILGENMAYTCLMPGPVGKATGHFPIEQISLPSEEALHINPQACGPVGLWTYRSTWKSWFSCLQKTSGIPSKSS